MKKTLLALTLLLTSAAPSFAAGVTEIYAVRLYADWCGSCKTLDANLAPIRANIIANQPVEFVVFDNTNDATFAAAATKAEALGIDDIYTEYGKKTGLLLLIDAETKEVMQEINKTFTTQQIQAAVDESLNIIKHESM